MSRIADWRHGAACTGEDPELFFPIGTDGPALLQIAEAKTVCRCCPVAERCLSWALDSGQDAGVLGRDERGRTPRAQAPRRPRPGEDRVMAAAGAPAAWVGEQLGDVADLVRRICVSRLGVEDGADAAQEVMLRLWRAVQRPTFRAEGLYGYAATLARYEVMRAYGTRDRHRHTGLGAAAEHVIADPAPGPAERVEQQLDAAAAVSALAQVLSPRQRTVLGVSMATDWDTCAVAARLDLSESGVRSAQVRAMAQLRAAAGARSRNPLASQLSEHARRRRRAAAHDPASSCGAGHQEVLVDVAA